MMAKKMPHSDEAEKILRAMPIEGPHLARLPEAYVETPMEWPPGRVQAPRLTAKGLTAREAALAREDAEQVEIAKQRDARLAAHAAKLAARAAPAKPKPPKT